MQVRGYMQEAAKQMIYLLLGNDLKESYAEHRSKI